MIVVILLVLNVQPDAQFVSLIFFVPLAKIAGLNITICATKNAPFAILLTLSLGFVNSAPLIAILAIKTVIAYHVTLKKITDNWTRLKGDAFHSLDTTKISKRLLKGNLSLLAQRVAKHASLHNSAQAALIITISLLIRFVIVLARKDIMGTALPKLVKDALTIV